jgi:hypothetical protein
MFVSSTFEWRQGIAANVYVYDGLGFRSASCPTLLNEIKKTKLEIYTSPQAGINILLAPVQFVHPCLNLFFSPTISLTLYYLSVEHLQVFHTSSLHKFRLDEGL